MCTRNQPDRRLLLVDDDFGAREMLSVVLAGFGYRGATAANGTPIAWRRPYCCTFCEFGRRPSWVHRWLTGSLLSTTRS